MKDKVEDLRQHLFETIEALKDPDNPMEIERAKAINEVSQTLVESAKAETQHLRVVGDLSGTGMAGSGFMPNKPRPPKPLGGHPVQALENGEAKDHGRR